MSLFRNAKQKFRSVRSNSLFSQSKLSEEEPSHGRQMRQNSIGGFSSLAEEIPKKKPSGYMFLIKTDPRNDWEVISELSVNKEQEEPFKEKLIENKNTKLVAHSKIVDRFSDDHFDEYLFELGILDDCLPKFEDYMCEIEILRACNHSNLQKFYDAYYFDSTLWLITEYYPIGSIEKLIEELNKPLNEIQIQYITKEVLQGLYYLNERCKIAHGDLKAGNLLISDDLFIKISNFHVASKNNRLKAEEKRYLFINSPHYIAPEVLNFEKTIDDYEETIKCDVWSYGITCIEIAEKIPPYTHINPEAVIDEIKFAKTPPSLKEPSNWSLNFIDFLSRCLNRNPENRESASQLLKHKFITESKSTKSVLENLLNERKMSLYSGTRQVIDDLENKLSEMKLIKDHPDLYVYNYFQDLKTLIELKAEEAKNKIEKEHQNFLESLKLHEDECYKNLNFTLINENNIEKLKSKYEEKSLTWNLQLSSKEINDSALKLTELEANQLSKHCESELNSLKSKLFSQKNIFFEPFDKDSIRFGYLKVNTEFESHVNRKNSESKLDTKNNENKNTYPFKPMNKLIRFELKQAKKKSK